MTNSLTSEATLILAQYAPDRGQELAQEAGPAAAQKAGELWQIVAARLSQSETGSVVANGFAANPEIYRQPVAHELQQAAQADADFAARLRQLLAEYEAARQSFVATAAPGHQARIKSGAAAQGAGATAVGQDGLNLSGAQVGGSIVTGKIEAGGDFVGRDKTGSAIDQNAQAELARLLQELEKALSQAPAEKQEEAEAVLVVAQELVDKAAAPKPNKTSIQISGDGLKQAAQNLAAVAPTVLTIAGQIVTAISRALP